MADEPKTKTMEELSKQLGEMFELVKTRDAQIAEQGEANTKLGDLITAQDERLQAIAAEVEHEKSRSDELEKKFGRPGFNGGASEFKSVGQQVIESEQFKSLLKSQDNKTSKISVAGLYDLRQKAITSDSLSAGAMITPDYIPGIIKPPERIERVRDLFTVASTNSDMISYVEETGFAPLQTVLTAVATIGQKEIVVDNVEGFYAHSTAAYRQDVMVGTEAHKVDSIVAATKTITLVANLAAEQASGTIVTSQTFSPTVETHEKPQSGITYERKNYSVAVLAHWLPITNQALMNAPQVMEQINGRLLYGLGLAEDEQLLYGDGTGDNLHGILTNTDVQSYDWSDGTVGDTKIDAIRRAMTLARLAEYPVDGIVVHPTDWEDIELIKGSDEHYIWLTVQTGTGMQMFRAQVTETTAIRAGESMTGAFRLGATVYDRQAATIKVADQHGTYFVENTSVILAEQYETLATFRPEAFVKIGFDAAPTL